MSTSSGFDFLRFRDGTSQQQRISKALDPDFFALDERSLWDLLQFAQRYAGTLIYFNQNNEAAGDWSGFLEGDKDTLSEMVAYLKNPSYFDHQPEKKERYSRPHFTLFLTFLSLLQEAQVQMNQITQRQLDFYYRQALGLRRRPGRPDRVHLLAELEPEEDQVLIPKGTQLFAGEDEELVRNISFNAPTDVVPGDYPFLDGESTVCSEWEGDFGDAGIHRWTEFYLLDRMNEELAAEPEWRARFGRDQVVSCDDAREYQRLRLEYEADNAAPPVLGGNYPPEPGIELGDQCRPLGHQHIPVELGIDLGARGVLVGIGHLVGVVGLPRDGGQDLLGELAVHSGRRVIPERGEHPFGGIVHHLRSPERLRELGVGVGANVQAADQQRQRPALQQ